MLNKKSVVCGIVAVGPDNVIGHNGCMPWHSKQDFYHFRKTTTPWPVIFGKNTYDGMPKKPLPNRFNLVCSSHYNDEYIDGVFYAKSLESALNQCKDFERIFICGGASIYKYVLNKDLLDIMYITKLHDDNLKKQILLSPMSYARFPFNSDEFFSQPKWACKKISYPDGILPPEQTSIFPEFYEYIRVR